MSKKIECPDCGAKTCEQIELNIWYCSLCDKQFGPEDFEIGDIAGEEKK